MEPSKIPVAQDSDLSPYGIEGVLSLFYSSLSPLSRSRVSEDTRDYQAAIKTLNDFAQRYGVRTPERVLESPEQARELAEARENMSPLVLWDILATFGSMIEDGENPESANGQDIYELKQTLLRVFERHEIAAVEQEGHERKLRGWKMPREYFTLDRILTEEGNLREE